jgi:antitoxin FitA
MHRSTTEITTESRGWPMPATADDATRNLVESARPRRRGGILSEGPRQILTSMAQCEIIEINDLMERPMAGNLHVRNLDDDLIARLKRRAARHGRSTEAEHREILRQALIGDVEPSFDTLAADLRKLTKRRKQTPSEVLLREGREER